MQNSTGEPDRVSRELHWQDYEELVKDISEALGRDRGVTVECWGRKCTVEGPPGNYSQIDVLTTHSDGLQRYRTAISCRWRNAKVGVSHVREIAHIVQDANLSKGVIVSKNGFTKPATRLAEAKNIGLVELRQPTDKDWDDSIKEVRIDIAFDVGRALHDVRFRRAAPISSYEGECADEQVAMPDPLVIGLPGHDDKTLIALAEQALKDNPEQEEFEIEFPEGTVLRTPTSSRHPAGGRGVTSVSFRLQPIPPLRSKIVVRAEDHIYMIMRNLLEDRHYNITMDGKVIEAI